MHVRHTPRSWHARHAEHVRNLADARSNGTSGSLKYFSAFALASDILTGGRTGPAPMQYHEGASGHMHPETRSSIEPWTEGCVAMYAFMADVISGQVLASTVSSPFRK